ncbi:MAG: HzsA-related protein, partial [Planctomycetota bacterium]
MGRPTATVIILLAVLVVPGMAGDMREAASPEGIERDWLLQDYTGIVLPEELQREKQQWRDKHLKAPESKPDAPVLKDLACFVSDAGCVVEQRMVARVCEELGGDGESIRAEAQMLVNSRVPGNDPRWKELYLGACRKRRAKRLRPLLARWQRFVFDQRHHVPNTWKYTEGLSDAQSGRFFKPGASLNVLEMEGPYGKVRTLLADPGGILRNPDVSYDGERLLFAWKKSDRQDDYHLYEMDLDTQAVRQLTHGLGFADYEGVYLPDGNICFSSTRCVQTVDCNWTEVSNLYLMDRRGRYMRRVGFDQVHTIFPAVTDDGRVLYTRWDYNDRAQIYTQPLFQMNSDGTKQREFYGNNSWFPTNIIHSRKIPGSRKVLAIITGHHRAAHGKLGIIDPGRGRQEGRGVQLIAPVRKTEPIRVDKYALGGNQFQYPCPLDEQRFLVTLALPTPDGKLGRFNIYFMDRDGRRELLVEGHQTGEGIGCRQIVPLAARQMPHVPPSKVDYRITMGTFYLQNVYEGPGLSGVPRGTVKRLRVVALEFRAAGLGTTKQRGAGGTSNVSTPIAVGNGSWDVKVVLGSAKVFEDGSACFKVPARTPVYFQALDEKNYCVQTMRSWTTLMPGENQACVGCHEHKNSAPRAKLGT